MDFKKENFKHLDQFLNKNKGICWKTFNLLDQEEVKKLSFDRLNKYKDKLISQLKAWQRLLRIIPEGERQEEIIKALMKKNLHSAIQIASMPKKRFLKECSPIFLDDDQALKVYATALGIRTQITLTYMNLKQNGESHINATRFHNVKREE